MKTAHTRNNYQHIPVVLCAMDIEAQPFFDKASHHDSIASYGKSQWYYVESSCGIEKKDCERTAHTYDYLLAITGIGLANAASAATIAITQFMPPAILYAGTAGGLDTHLHVRDIVCGTRYFYGTADATMFGYQLGQIPGMPASYDCDSQLLDYAKEVSSVYSSSHIRAGSVACSDKFMNEKNAQVFRHDFPGTLSVDMESAAAAQVCSTYHVPFISLRSVSDLCSPEGAEEFHVNAEEAAACSARIVHHVLASLTRSNHA